MRVLLTNDDGLAAEGLQAVRRALLEVPGVELEVIAPDGNRSAMARSITTRRPLWVERVDFGDGTHGYATDGTPVDCVRLAASGLVDGFQAEMVVAGANHGSNMADDITYSGTVAAALEGVMLGLPAIAVSQQSAAREMDFRLGEDFDFTAGAAFVARLLRELEETPLPPRTLVNVNVPADTPSGVEICRLGRRLMREELRLVEEDDAGRRCYWMAPSVHGYEDEPGTDLGAVAAGRIAVTPLHFDLTDAPGMEALVQRDLARLLPAGSGA
jgi:5'-nucleotidase